MVNNNKIIRDIQKKLIDIVSNRKGKVITRNGIENNSEETKVRGNKIIVITNKAKILEKILF